MTRPPIWELLTVSMDAWASSGVAKRTVPKPLHSSAVWAGRRVWHDLLAHSSTAAAHALDADGGGGSLLWRRQHPGSTCY